LQGREVPRFPRNAPLNFAAKESAEFVAALRFLQRFRGILKSLFLTSFLLAHCGGGQDKPGLPWPLSEAPRLSLFFPAFCFSFLKFSAFAFPFCV